MLGQRFYTIAMTVRRPSRWLSVLVISCAVLPLLGVAPRAAAAQALNAPLFPGVAISFLVMACNLTGDWLRNRLDPNPASAVALVHADPNPSPSLRGDGGKTAYPTELV